MMNMDCCQPREAEAMQEMEQNDRITTAGESYPKALIRREAGGEKDTNPLQQVS